MHDAQDRQLLEVFYLPELNPEELLNADLKHAMGKSFPARSKTKLRDAANQDMTFLENSPDKVQSCFQDPRVKYAAKTFEDWINKHPPSS